MSDAAALQTQTKQSGTEQSHSHCSHSANVRAAERAGLTGDCSECAKEKICSANRCKQNCAPTSGRSV